MNTTSNIPGEFNLEILIGLLTSNLDGGVLGGAVSLRYPGVASARVDPKKFLDLIPSYGQGEGFDRPNTNQLLIAIGRGLLVRRHDLVNLLLGL